MIISFLNEDEIAVNISNHLLPNDLKAEKATPEIKPLNASFLIISNDGDIIIETKNTDDLIMFSWLLHEGAKYK